MLAGPVGYAVATSASKAAAAGSAGSAAGGWFNRTLDTVGDIVEGAGRVADVTMPAWKIYRKVRRQREITLGNRRRRRKNKDDAPMFTTNTLLLIGAAFVLVLVLVKR